MCDVSTTTRYRLVAPDRSVVVPELDEHQQRVVDHEGGPLLVLAGPGTGKTTTLVEAIVDRAQEAGGVLALTFSRKAAEQMRDRVTARMGATTTAVTCSTFHSFAYSLVRRYAPTELYAAPLRLLSAPEQDVVLSELLTTAPESVAWPDGLRAAVGTRGFAREVQDVLARARERGLDPEDLTELGRREGLPVLEAAGLFMEQFLDVMAAQSAIDYPDLIARAVIEATRHRDELRAEFAHVFVDEYQDTDPSQVELLRQICGDGRNLTVVGDPDQSIYGFRGAEVRGILDFPRAFPRRDGRPADVVALGTTRRFGSRLLAVSRRVAGRIAVSGSIPVETFEQFRSPEPTDSAWGPGRVDVLTFDTQRAEVEHVADLLRRAHLEDDVPWGEMAVLVRSGRASVPPLRRALVAAGIPVEVARDEVPLVREPAVVPLLDALRVVVDRSVDDPQHPDFVTPDRIEALLVSPLGGLDATDLRGLARGLRAADDTGASSPDLVRSAILDGTRLDEVEGVGVAKARRLARLLASAAEVEDGGGTVEEVLWALWAGTDWGLRLRALTDRGGHAARLAHRDLDAVCALFETAARAEERTRRSSVAEFLHMLRAQQIPGDTLADNGVRGESVRLLTAHRSKGLEWRLVVVAHVQEGGWPDLRRRGSLLGADRISRDGLLPEVTRAAMLAEERRLFYVACTRARQRLVITAERSPDDDGEQPSRFLAELGHQSVHAVGRPVRPLSLAGLVADLRKVVGDSDSPPALRDAAAERLVRLADTQVHGHPVVAAADPGTWWGMRALSRSERPVRPDAAPVALSASALEGLLTCPAQWFLSREAGGEQTSSASQGFGNLVHALADRVARGEIAQHDDVAEAVDDLMSHVDRVWDRLAFRTPWSRSRERVALHAALSRFLAWHRRPGAATRVETEVSFRAEVSLPDGQRVLLNGRADRLEVDDDGRVVVIDLKTGKYLPTDKSLPDNPQLGLYQYAVDHGAVDDVLGGPTTAAGAALVQLRAGSDLPKVQEQAPQAPDADGLLTIERQLMQAAAVVRAEDFVARPGPHCERCPFHAVCPTKSSGSVLS